MSTRSNNSNARPDGHPDLRANVPLLGIGPWLNDVPSVLATPHPSLIELASFLDGKMENERRLAIEKHVLECLLCQEAKRDIADAMQGGEGAMVFVPPHVVRAAMALRSAEPAQLRTMRINNFRSMIWIRSARHGLAAAAAIAVCLIGHRIGAAISGAGEVSAAAQQGESLGTAMSFGVFESAAPSIADLELLGAEEAGT